MDSIKEGLIYAGGVIVEGVSAVVKAVVFIVCLPFNAVYAVGSFIGRGIAALFNGKSSTANGKSSTALQLKYQWSNDTEASAALGSEDTEKAPAPAPAPPPAPPPAPEAR